MKDGKLIVIGTSTKDINVLPPKFLVIWSEDQLPDNSNRQCRLKEHQTFNAAKCLSCTMRFFSFATNPSSFRQSYFSLCTWCLGTPKAMNLILLSEALKLLLMLNSLKRLLWLTTFQTKNKFMVCKSRNYFSSSSTSEADSSNPQAPTSYHLTILTKLGKYFLDIFSSSTNPASG